MFHYLNNVINYLPSVESLDQEKIAKRHEFLVSRLERRWNYNKNSPSKARTSIKQIESKLSTIKKRMNDKFDTKKFSSLIEHKQFIDFKLMSDGLEQIPNLSKVFSILVSQPPSQESGNLPGFKKLMVDSVKKHTPAYAYNSYQIYALFMVEKSLIKKNGSLEKAGYNESFFDHVEKAIVSTEKLIKDMESYEPLVHKLAEDIVTALMGKDAVKYQHARRQFELVNTQWTSILTLAPFQYLNMAVSTTNTISQCF